MIIVYNSRTFNKICFDAFTFSKYSQKVENLKTMLYLIFIGQFAPSDNGKPKYYYGISNCSNWWDIVDIFSGFKVNMNEIFIK